MKQIRFYTALALSAMLLAACNDDLGVPPAAGGSGQRIQLSGEIDQLAVTRVNDEGFADGDVMGVYIVDYNGTQPGTLQVSGNRGDNVYHTFDEANYRWNSAYDVYWKDKHTPIDVYGYYPAGSPSSIEAYAFTVQADQSTEPTDGRLGGYEASDFLWGMAGNIAPTTNVVRLALSHRMANARVTLVQGEGFESEEWLKTEKSVLLPNLVRQASINLSDGSVRPNGSVEKNATVPGRTGDEWRAIVVPQTVSAGTTLFSITIGGMPYKFSKDEDFTYTAGRMSNFAIRVDKKEASGDYALTLISESITPWENDQVSHDAQAKEYIIINSTQGHLKDSLIAANKDYTRVRNLKVKGEMNADDCEFIRTQMTSIQALNLKEVKVWDKNKLVIPKNAFFSLRTLNRIVLPDSLQRIDNYAFSGCNLTGSLIIPEGVMVIGLDAFSGCGFLTGILSLPSTLQRIGEGAFRNCKFTCELMLPNALTSIGGDAFQICTNLYGPLHLPDNLEEIGSRAFGSCSGLRGDLVIPKKMKKIAGQTFQNMNLGGNLVLHDGIQIINGSAFDGAGLRGELNLPKDLITISSNAFARNNFSGNLVLPKGLLSIGDNVFTNNGRLTGTVVFPEELLSIGKEAFAGCGMLEGLQFPASLETIGAGAFKNCFGIGSIVCEGAMPAYVTDGAFNGVPKDNFVLEVPEAAVNDYQTAQGWCDFKRVAAHHELVCRPQVACALSTEHKQTLVIDAEGYWEVAEKPDWVEVSPASGNKKSEVTLTIHAMGQTDGEREGDVVFRLMEKEYTHKLHVSQYGYEYGEDEPLTLQTATRGNNGGINLIFLGDGYEAQDIASGQYLADIKQQVEHFFAIEPYKTYRDYFNVYTAFPLSTETGVGTVNTIRYNRFNTTFTGGVGLKADNEAIFRYCLDIAPTLTEENLGQSLIVMTPNSKDYGGICHMWPDGSAIAFCPMIEDAYPLDARGVLQHEAGGHGFGKLLDEYIYHNAFIDDCKCTCCDHAGAIIGAKAMGWGDNLELTGKMHEVGWSHLIFDLRYSAKVDIYEGGYMHSRGVFRSEQNSCMNNNIPYFSTISRESIVRRIKRYAGEEFYFEDFAANDNGDAAVVSRSVDQATSRAVHSRHAAPVIHKGSPLGKK